MSGLPLQELDPHTKLIFLLYDFFLIKTNFILSFKVIQGGSSYLILFYLRSFNLIFSFGYVE